MSSSGFETGWICRSYTHARRFPLVIGRLREMKLPFVFTLTQAATFLVSLAVMWRLRPLWQWLLPSWMLIVVPFGLAYAAKKVRIEGRPPVKALAGVLPLILNPPHGFVHGRPQMPRPHLAWSSGAMYLLAPIEPEPAPVVAHGLRPQRTMKAVVPAPVPGGAVVGAGTGGLMRFPAYAVDGHLKWSVDGGVWAVWRVQPVSYRTASTETRLKWASQIRSALMILPAESMLLSACRPVDPEELRDRMLHGIDPSTCKSWVRHVERTVEHESKRADSYERYFFVAVCLPDEGRRRAASSTFGAATAWWSGLFGFRPTPPTDAQRRARHAQAKKFEGQLRAALSAFRPRRATIAELRWLDVRVPYRAVLDPGVEHDSRVSSWEHLVDAKWREGGNRSDPDRPRHRRYLSVETEQGVSYQSFIAVSGMPHEWLFPGGAGEWLADVDLLDFPVDWCVRVASTPNAEARRKSRRKHNELVHQTDEYRGDVTGIPPELEEAVDAIGEHRAELVSSGVIPDLWVTTVFAMASSSAQDLDHQAEQLRSVFEAYEYEMSRPTGQQLSLCRSTLIGSAAPLVVKDYAQSLFPRDLASAMPFASSRIGTPAGIMLGHVVDSGTLRPFFIDPEWTLSKNETASMALSATLGGGKSETAKIIVGHVIDRDGQAAIIDQTEMGEWVQFARAQSSDKAVKVVDLREPTTCLDPFRVFQGADRIKFATGWLTIATGVTPTELEGVTLARAVKEAAKTADARLADVPRALRAFDTPVALQLAQRLEHLADDQLGRVVFGDGDPLGLDADCVVFWAPDLDLPDERTLTNEHLASRMRPEQVLSLANMYLLAGVVRRILLADRTRLAVGAFEEFWRMKLTPQGSASVNELLREVRRHKSFVIVMSQDADAGAGDLSDLFGWKLVGRHKANTAHKALEWLHLDPDESWVQQVTEFRDGRFLAQDPAGNTAKVQIMEPLDQKRLTHYRTTPPGTHEASEEAFEFGRSGRRGGQRRPSIPA